MPAKGRLEMPEYGPDSMEISDFEARAQLRAYEEVLAVLKEALKGLGPLEQQQVKGILQEAGEASSNQRAKRIGEEVIGLLRGEE
jgi:hypothetical protein